MLKSTVGVASTRASFQFSEVQWAPQNLCMSCIVSSLFHFIFIISYQFNLRGTILDSCDCPVMFLVSLFFLPPAGYLDDIVTALSMPLIAYYIHNMCNWLWNACGGCENIKWAVFDLQKHFYLSTFWQNPNIVLLRQHCDHYLHWHAKCLNHPRRCKGWFDELYTANKTYIK